MPNCTAYHATNIAVVYNSDESAAAAAGNAALDTIADRILSAYKEQTGNILYKQPFKDDKSVNRVVKDVDYVANPICFGIGWNKFSPEDKEYDIDIRMGYS